MRERTAQPRPNVRVTNEKTQVTLKYLGGLVCACHQQKGTRRRQRRQISRENRHHEGCGGSDKPRHTGPGPRVQERVPYRLEKRTPVGGGMDVRHWVRRNVIEYGR